MLPCVGRYEIVREVGRGGMGVVYEARDPGLGRRVAVKVLRDDLDNDNLAARMRREGIIAARLRHPNIVAVHEAGAVDFLPYVVMDFLPGPSLQDLLYTLMGNWREQAALLEKVARAAQCAHENGIIHRDLKPGNVLFDANGEPVVTDFGLAREIATADHVTRSGVMIGTPVYMAPEQVRGDTKRADARSDVYALGAMLYEMMAGRPPFVAESTAALFRKIMDDDPPPLLGAPAELETICMKALAKEPRERYASAGDMADDLRRSREGEPIRARPVSTFERLARKAWRHKAFTAATIALLMALVALPLQIGRSRRRESALQRLAAQGALILECKRDLRALRAPVPVARRELADAVRAVDAHVDEWPYDPRGYYIRARGRMYLGDYDGAERDLACAVARAPDFRPGWALLGMLKIEEYQQRLYAPEGCFSGRMKALRPLLDEALALFDRGWQDGRERADAARWGLPWTREDQVMERLARAFRLRHRAGCHEEALRLLRDAMDVYQAEEYAVWLGAWAHNAAERVRLTTLAIGWAPGYEKAWFDRGYAKRMAGDFKGAVEDLTRAIEMQPLHAPGWNFRGYAKLRLKDVAGARADFDRAIELCPKYAHAHYYLGVAKRGTGDFRGSIADLDRAIALRPRYTAAFNARGLARQRLGDLAGALADFDRAIELKKGYMHAYYNRGRVRIAMGDEARAVVDYEAAVRLAPEDWVRRKSVVKWLAAHKVE